MNQAPEGLEYGHDNDKYAKTDVLTGILERGKMLTGAMPSPEHEKAETLRMLHCGSHDPVYENSKKNR